MERYSMTLLRSTLFWCCAGVTTFCTAAPTITSFSPPGGPPGTAVTINGSNFSSISAYNLVQFNGVYVTTNTSSSTTQIVAAVPSGATTGRISVTVGSGSVATSATNFVVGPLPTIVSFTASGPVGSTVSISGTNFSPTAANDSVAFNGVVGTVTSASATQLLVTVPAAATTGKITVTVNGGLIANSSTNFTVTVPMPTCGAVTSAATVATTASTQRVSVSGVQNASNVLFPTWWLPGRQSDLQWLQGTNAGNGNWYVDVPLAQYDSGNPRYGDFKTTVYLFNSAYSDVYCGSQFWTWTFPPPTISGMSPTSGPIYKPVVISGTNFSSTLSEDQVTFNGEPAAVTAASATQLTVAVPSGATSGPVFVTVNGLTHNAGYFSVTPFTYDGSQWQNACQISDPKLLRLMQSEAFLVQRANLHGPNADGTYSIDGGAYNTANKAYPLDPTSPFYGEPQAVGGRSGFLIGPRLMMTAPHQQSFDPSLWAVVFNFSPALVNGTGYQNYVCQYPSLSSIPASNVFFPDLSQPVVDTYRDVVQFGGRYDYASFYLTQSPNRPYLRVRRSGLPRVGDPAAEIGHPDRLTTKISPAVELFDSQGLTVQYINGGHEIQGTSGSMIYNLAHDYIEDTLAAGPLIGYGGCISFNQLSNSKYVMAVDCQGVPNYQVNAPVVGVADQFPAYSLVVAPQSDETDRIPVGGTASTTYSMSTPATAAGPISWRLVAPTGLLAGSPTITFAPTATSGVLPLGSTTTFAATVGNAGQCGRFDETIKLNDLSNGFTDSLTHHIEVGLTDFSLSPATDFVYDKAQPPFAATSMSATVNNPRPTPITLSIMPSANWVTLSYTQNGSPATTPVAGTITVTLGAAGSATASATVLISVLDAVADAFPPLVEQDATVTFSNTDTSACALTTSAVRGIKFTSGKQEYVGVDNEGLNIWPGPLDESLTVPDNFAIRTLAVDVGIADQCRNDAVTTLSDFSAEKFVLISPSGQRLTLWNGNATPSSAYFNFDPNVMVGTLQIDDTLSPSPLLSTLQGQSALGQWTLEASAATGSSSSCAVIIDWVLRFTKL